MTEISDHDKATLQRLEESLWIAETRFDLSYMETVLAPDFYEFGRSGRVYDRGATLEIESAPFDAVIPLPDLKIRLLTPDVAQLTYNSQVNYPGGAENGRRSSIWTRTGVSWQLRFHQGTSYSL